MRQMIAGGITEDKTHDMLLAQLLAPDAAGAACGIGLQTLLLVRGSARHPYVKLPALAVTALSVVSLGQ